MTMRTGLTCAVPNLPINPVPLTPLQPQLLPVSGILGRPAFDGPEIAVPRIPIAGELARVTRLDPKLMVPAPAPPPAQAMDVEPTPMLELRVRAVIAYDNGASPPLTIAQARERVAALVESANKDLQGSGVRLVFFPRADVEMRQDSTLRRHIDLSDEAIAKLESGTVDEADGKLIIEAGAAKVEAHRQAVGDEQPGKMLWLFTTGNQFIKKFDADGKFVKWQHINSHGGSYSDIKLQYVAMNQAFLGTLANAAADASRAVHETGHYLGLPHTHRQSFADIASMLTLEEQQLAPALRLALWKAQIGSTLAAELTAGGTGATLKAAREAFDTDRSHNIFDTPADPGGGMIALANEVAGHGNNAYGPVNEVTITVPGVTEALTLSPMRDNLMSYYLDDKTPAVMRLTPDQVKRVRANLAGDPQRRRLVAAQLGDSATPDLRVCAVWSPNANNQRLAWNQSLNAHKAEHDTMRAKGMALAHVQAYTRNGSVRYDGIWNPSTQKQEVSLGLTDAAVKAEQSVRLAKGLRPVRVQGYQHLTDGIRYNVIYDSAVGSGSQILLGVTQDVLFDEYAKAKKKEMRMIALSSHVNGHGQTRYSSIFRTSKNVNQVWVVNRTLGQIMQESDKHAAAGLKIREMSVVKLGSGHRWSALFEAEAAHQVVSWMQVRERIGEVYDQMWAIDFKLRGMCAVTA